MKEMGSLPPGLGIGVGSQPMEEDGAQLDYMEMPSGMVTFSMSNIPEPEDTKGLEAAKHLLADVHASLLRYKIGQPSLQFDLMVLDEANLAFVDQVLGEGEVSVVAGSGIQAQESILAGVWRVHHADDSGKIIRNIVEVSAFPSEALAEAFRAGTERVPQVDEDLPAGVCNAPPLLTEINDKIASFCPDSEPHAINLTLLPQTEEDLAFLDSRLGTGSVIVLSRGYGNCRITSSGTKYVWWVQYFNSQDALILNMVEVNNLPQVACAAEEDIADSAERLGEILEVYK